MDKQKRIFVGPIFQESEVVSATQENDCVSQGAILTPAPEHTPQPQDRMLHIARLANDMLMMQAHVLKGPFSELLYPLFCSFALAVNVLLSKSPGPIGNFCSNTMGEI
jgi:hypothetical protein